METVTLTVYVGLAAGVLGLGAETLSSIHDPTPCPPSLLISIERASTVYEPNGASDFLLVVRSTDSGSPDARRWSWKNSTLTASSCAVPGGAALPLTVCLAYSPY